MATKKTAKNNVTPITKDIEKAPESVQAELKPVRNDGNPEPTEKPVQGLKSMTQRDVDQYMEDLLKNKIVLVGIEKQALDQFTGISRGLNMSQQQLQQGRQQVLQLEDHVKRTQGQLDAYANLLIAAEDTRRASKK